MHKWLIVAIAFLTAGTVSSQHFAEVPRWADPLRGPIQSAGSVTFEDIDEDGDEDLVYNVFEMVKVENTPEGFEWPTVFTEYGLHSHSFIDVDADGDMDIVGQRSLFADGYYLEQREDGMFAPHDGDSPLPVMYPANEFFPYNVDAADLNGDGLVDLVVGLERFAEHPYVGKVQFIQQSEPGRYIVHTGDSNPFESISWTNRHRPNPALGDVDGDGDVDAVILCGLPEPGYCQGRYYRYFEQTAELTFVERTGTMNPFRTFVRPYDNSDLVLRDFDADGDIDALLSDGRAWGEINRFTYYERLDSGEFVLVNDPYTMTNGFEFENSYTYGLPIPAFGDLDGDGDEDLVVGESGGLTLLHRTASVTEPFEVGANPFAAITGVLAPTLGDLDEDGDLDLIAVSDSVSRRIRYFEQTTSMVFVERTGSENPFHCLLGAGPSALGDVDGDGDLDLVIGDRRASDRHERFRYFEQTASMTFVERYDVANPFGGLRADGCAMWQTIDEALPVLADLDNDGDMDLINDRCFFQQESGGFFPVWSADNPLLSVAPADAELVFYGRPISALVDLDQDGDLDAIKTHILASSSPAHFRTYLNTGLPVTVEPRIEAVGGSYQLTVPVPNPVSSTARLTLSVEKSQAVGVALYDVLGRQLAHLYDGFAAARSQLELTVEAELLPAGVYIIRVEGEAFTTATRLVVAR